jgi:hypothetical protein
LGEAPWNCIAYVLEDRANVRDYVPLREYSVERFDQMMAERGYRPVTDLVDLEPSANDPKPLTPHRPQPLDPRALAFEPGVDKVAIYALPGEAIEHAAIQFGGETGDRAGWWYHKLGTGPLIRTRTVDDMADDLQFGHPFRIYARPSA